MRWVVLAVGFWFCATFAVVYAAVELAEDDVAQQPIFAENQRCEEATSLFDTVDSSFRFFTEQKNQTFAGNLVEPWNQAFNQMVAACSGE